MKSKLVITGVDKLQERIENTLRGLEGSIGIYISLNKTQKSLEKDLLEKGIDISKIFFIDCVTSEKEKDEVLHLSPYDLEALLFSINDFIKNIQSEKFLIIDALSTLLIYNTENKVAEFIHELTNRSLENTQLIAFSPETKGEELLKKIFNFFDEVDKF